MIVWDRGRWQPEGDPVRGLTKGRLDFTLEGAKLNGRWHLVRMAAKRGEKRENWLLIKGSDDEARTAADPDILTEAPASRHLRPHHRTASPPASPPPKSRRREGEGPLPRLHPAGARHPETEAAPGDAWVHEIKFDGYRIQAQVRAGKVRLLTRSGQDWTDRFGPVAAALAALPATTAILDGELVVDGPAGASDFSALQADLAAGRTDRILLLRLRPALPRRRRPARQPLPRRKDAPAAHFSKALPTSSASASTSTRTAR